MSINNWRLLKGKDIGNCFPCLSSNYVLLMYQRIINNTIKISKIYVYIKSVKDEELKGCLKINIAKGQTTNGTLYNIWNIQCIMGLGME